MENSKKYIYLSLTVLITVFIFYNSTRNGTESTNASNGVMIFVNNLLQNLGISVSVKSIFIRKLAHFVEFFVLGFFIMLTFQSFSNKILQNLGFSLFLSLFIPVLDETIQIFSEGRSSQVLDVLLDFSGSFTGVSFIFLIFLFKKVKKF